MSSPLTHRDGDGGHSQRVRTDPDTATGVLGFDRAVLLNSLPQVRNAAQRSHPSRRSGSLSPRGRQRHDERLSRLDVRTLLRNIVRMAVRTRITDWTDEPKREPKRIPVNLSLPEDLVEALDEVAGPRRRSAFAEEALRRAIKREQLRVSIERTAGSLPMEHYPHWRSSEDVVAWVREMRAEETSTEREPT
jgi:hypothetical protein